MIAHGIDTTIVEIDPVVYDFAKKYFALLPNHTAVIADAVQWSQENQVDRVESYDYIIHDVFTGGAEPIDLFTEEFLSSLSAMLKPNGIIAIVSSRFGPSYLKIRRKEKGNPNWLCRTTPATLPSRR